jgi:hypothetical protein
VPSTVGSLFAAATVARTGVVSWGKRIPKSVDGGLGTGVYAVALTDELDSMDQATSACPLSDDAMQELLEARPELTLDDERPDASQLGQRLASFWCPDEVVLYIGLAGPRQRVTVSELSDRVAEYYSTPLGARTPHAGGWPLKTLTSLTDFHVHFAYCDDVLIRERLMLDAFADSLSDTTRVALHDATAVMPFANLVDGRGSRKRHGIHGARAPRHRKETQQRTANADAQRRRTSQGVASLASKHRIADQTQTITAGDIQRGVIRIPSPAKTLFPKEKASIAVDLRGERKSCRWDPRYGPDQERSGVIGVGSVLTRRLLTAGERLAIQVEDDVVFLN